MASTSSKRPLSKREQEEIKKKDDLKRSAEVFSEFIQAFEETEPSKKFTTFVRGGVVNPGKGEESHAGDPSEKIYALKPKASSSRPRSRSKERSSHHHHAPPAPASKSATISKKLKDKKKSNLEIFKEELKQIQEEREERRRLKDQISKIETKLGTSVSLPASSHSFLDDDPRVFDGTYDLSGEANSTNLYMGNLAPNITEEQLCEIFGRYGPVASVKIMYPRGEDREQVREGRTTLCGFVAFMCRIDAERALHHLRGREVLGCEMRLGWGKIVPIPTFPIYVPAKLAALLEPPPFSGLPFNAQPDAEDLKKMPKDGEPALSPAEVMDILSRSTVRVNQPQDRVLLGIIHRVIEFIVREGPIFEAMLMQRENGNPMYRFLFDNRCNEHVYYRWKLFSVLQGDTPTQWRMKEFRMFEGGPMWKPPPLNPFSNGMPEELVEFGDDPNYVKDSYSNNHKKQIPVEAPSSKAGLSENDREQLEKMLNELNPSRDSIADGMVFCIDHSEVAEDIIGAICKSLLSAEDPPLKKVAKVYLISDILHNCSGVHVQNAWYYRNGFEQKFPFIFTQIKKSHRSIEGRLKAEQYKQRVMNCFRAWEDWALYPPKYLIRLQNIFLGLEPGEEPEEELDGKPLVELVPIMPVKTEVDVDGIPMDEDVDGAPLEDIDGIALDPKTAAVAFAPSRWETVDPEQVKAQAITTSKWDQLEGGADDHARKKETAKGHTTKDLNDHVREKLREIEVRVMKYQDDLETGRRNRHPGESMSVQVEKYRKQLLSSAPGSSSSSSAKPRESRTRRSRSRSKSRSRSDPHSKSQRQHRSSHNSQPEKPSSREVARTSNSSQHEKTSRRSRSRDRDRRH